MGLLDAYRDAIASIESAGSGGYGAVGPNTGKGRAYGRYQVMDFNIGPWTKEVLGRPLTPEEFLADQRAQDAVFDAKFGQSVKKYGNPEDAASIWFTGRPASQGGNAQDVLGTTGNQYVSKFRQALGQQPIERGIQPMAQDKPQGLLAQFGIGRQDPNAQGQMAQPFYKRDNFKDFAGNLASGFNSMRMRPDPNLDARLAQKRQGRQNEQQKNRTAEWLAQNGREDLAQAVLSGSLGARDAVGILYQPKQDDSTALMKNYEFFLSQGMTPEQAMNAVRSGTTVNVGDTGPQVGTIPQGYELAQDPDTGAYRMRPIPGGPADNADKKALADEGTRRSGDVVLEDIDRVLSKMDDGGLPVAGMAGGILSNVPGTDAFDSSKLITTIKANVGFDRLQQMRDSSPTGGALGAINQSEMTLLNSALGNLEQSQSEGQFRENLIRLKKIYTQIVDGATPGSQSTEADPLGIR